jgi:broad specificity phosphatase PhoE
MLLFNIYAEAQTQITTVILLRHAEKASDGTQDPELSPQGVDRASRIAAMLKDTQIDAIYSTNLKRTKNTVSPLAWEKGIQVEFYEPNKTEALTDIFQTYQGKTIVICGHSNTIPWTANFIIGKNTYENFRDDEYNNLLVISFTEIGRNAKVTWLRY